MTTKLTFYKPSGADPEVEVGVHITVKLMKNNKNAAKSIAEALFSMAVAESGQQAVATDKLQANMAYDMAGGLTFRLFDDGLGLGNEVLEFAAQDETEPARSHALARIPNVLARAGVEQAALIDLRQAVPPPVRKRNPPG